MKFKEIINLDDAYLKTIRKDEWALDVCYSEKNFGAFLWCFKDGKAVEVLDGKYKTVVLSKKLLESDGWYFV